MRKWADKYKLRLERKALLFRARRTYRRLTVIQDNTPLIEQGAFLVISDVPALKEEMEEFLNYYRTLGAEHFLLIDSRTATHAKAHFSQQKDISVWRGNMSKNARNSLLQRFGHGHWCLSIGSKERFVYPHMDRRPLRALTDWLSASNKKSLGALQIDTYQYRQNRFFDSGNMHFSRHSKYQNLIAQGGVQQRVTFAKSPEKCPNLARIPLVFWSSRNAYSVDSKVLLPRSLNNVYATNGGQEACAAILTPNSEKDAWTCQSTKYNTWHDLEKLNLISRGQWA